MFSTTIDSFVSHFSKRYVNSGLNFDVIHKSCKFKVIDILSNKNIPLATNSFNKENFHLNGIPNDFLLLSIEFLFIHFPNNKLTLLKLP